ncbi:hypothetical protein MCEMSEM29_01987 [Methylophilaceae bacterium]
MPNSTLAAYTKTTRPKIFTNFYNVINMNRHDATEMIIINKKAMGSHGWILPIKLAYPRNGLPLY